MSIVSTDAVQPSLFSDPRLAPVPAGSPSSDRREARPEPVLLPSVIEIVAWADPTFETSGHDPRSAYVERFWLGLLGPSTTWLLRRFARGLDECPNGFRVDLVETGRALGLGESMARNSTTQRSIARACQFSVAYRQGERRLAVRTHLPTLTRRQVSRLPEALQRAHESWMHRPIDEADLRRATAAASGLLAAGEEPTMIERQLRTWGYPPRAALEASRSAAGW